MNVLKYVGYKSESIASFVKYYLKTEPPSDLNHFSDTIICFYENEKPARPISTDHTASWEDVWWQAFAKCSKRFQSSRLEDIRHLPKWKHLYKIIGTELMQFILLKSIVLIPINDSVFMPIVYDELLNKIRQKERSDKLKKHQSSLLLNDKKNYNCVETVESKRKSEAILENIPLPKEFDNSLKLIPKQKRRQKTKQIVKSVLDNTSHLQGFNEKLPINISEIMYSKNHAEFWPRNSAIVCRNFDSVLQMNVDCQSSTSKLEILFKSGYLEVLQKQIMKKIFCNHKRICYEKTIKHFLSTKYPEPSTDILKPLDGSQMHHLMCIILKKVLPVELFGNSYNYRMFIRSISKITSVNKHQVLPLKLFVNNIKTKNILWLKQIHNQNLQQALLAKVLLWIIKELVFKFLKIHFWITETSFANLRLVFYWKPIWLKNCEEELKNLVSSKSFINANGCLGVDQNEKNLYQLRFIPKKSGLRPILSNKIKLSGNEDVKNSKLLLTQLSRQYESSTHISNEFHSAWSKFIGLMKKCRQPKPFFVRCDVSNAYGTILQEKLVDILNHLRDKFLPDGGKLKVNKYLNIKLTGTVMSIRNIHIIKELCYPRLRNSLLLDTFNSKGLDSNSTLDITKKLIQGVRVSYENKCYWLKKGLPQGSPISSILCEIYFSHMVQEKLSYLADEDDILIKYVDDILFVTLDKKRALRYLTVIKQGISEYNCYFNDEKLKTNIDCQSVLTCCYAGYYLNFKNMHVQTDFSKYKNQRVLSSTSINFLEPPGEYLKRKLMSLIYLKLHPVLLNNCINSQLCILENIFHLALLNVFRMCGLIKELFTKGFNEIFLLRLIFNIVRKFSLKCHKIILNTNADSSISLSVLQCLTLKAFYLKLKCHRKTYSNICKKLGKKCHNYLLSQSFKENFQVKKISSCIPEFFLSMQ